MDRVLNPPRSLGGSSNALGAWLARRAGDQRALWAHLVRRWYAYLPGVLAWLLAQHYLLFNWTASLPYHVVWLHRGATDFARGDLIVYRYEGEELMHLKKGQRFFKRIAGLPGDKVAVEQRRVLVNGTDVGIAKQYMLDGHRLAPVAPGLIPPGYFYVQGTHEMSFDSRYRQSGLVRASQIIGKVDAIF
jgi:conjugal transfer pilin signal peptidase TrbI